MHLLRSECIHSCEGLNAGSAALECNVEQDAVGGFLRPRLLRKPPKKVVPATRLGGPGRHDARPVRWAPQSPPDPAEVVRFGVGKLKLETERQDMVPELAEIASAVQPDAERKGQALTVLLPPGVQGKRA
ncbi:hypothetical protein RCH10_004458 [Variovorax sp. GrIS 2.14]